MDIDKVDQLFRDLKKSDESARRKHGLGFGTVAQPPAPTAEPSMPIPAALPTSHRPFPGSETAPSSTTRDATDAGKSRGDRRNDHLDSERSRKRQRRSRSPTDRWALHSPRSLSRELSDGRQHTTQRKDRDSESRGGHRVRSCSPDIQRDSHRPSGGEGGGRGNVGGDDRGTGEGVEGGATGRNPGRERRSDSRNRDMDRTQRRSPSIRRRSPSVKRRHRSPSRERRRSPSQGLHGRSRSRRETSELKQRGSSPGYEKSREGASPYSNRRHQDSSLGESHRQDRDRSPRDSHRHRSRSPGKGGKPYSRDGDRGRVSRRHSRSPRNGGHSRSPRRRSPPGSRVQRRSDTNRQREGRNGRRSHSRGISERGRRDRDGRGEESNGRAHDRSTGMQRSEVKKNLDFSKLIEGFISMAPAQKLKAQTKYMLQQHTIRAKDTAGGQWTRLDLNPEALLEEEGAVPDMHFEELLEGAGPLTVASKRVAEQDASHANAIFGIPAQSSAAAGDAHRPVRHVQPVKQVRESSSDSDDAPVVVDLGEVHYNPPKVQENKLEAVEPAPVPKLNWREKAAILRQERQTQKDLKVGSA